MGCSSSSETADSPRASDSLALNERGDGFEMAGLGPHGGTDGHRIGSLARPVPRRGAEQLAMQLHIVDGNFALEPQPRIVGEELSQDRAMLLHTSIRTESFRMSEADDSESHNETPDPTPGANSLRGTRSLSSGPCATRRPSDRSTLTATAVTLGSWNASETVLATTGRTFVSDEGVPNIGDRDEEEHVDEDDDDETPQAYQDDFVPRVGVAVGFVGLGDTDGNERASNPLASVPDPVGQAAAAS